MKSLWNILAQCTSVSAACWDKDSNWYFFSFAAKLIAVRLLLVVLRAVMQMLAPQSPAQNGVRSTVAIDSQLALIPQRYPEVPGAGVIVTRRRRLRSGCWWGCGCRLWWGVVEGRGSQSVSYRRVKVKGLFCHKIMISTNWLSCNEDLNL